MVQSCTLLTSTVSSNLFTMDPDQAREMYRNMTDEQRAELAQKLDEQLDAYLDGLEASGERYMDGWSEDNWEEEMEKHPFFTKSLEDGQELSPLLKGIQDLKYSPEENSPEELAKSYKDDGNFHFKVKKYRLAVASYTEGLRQRCGERELETQLLTNRAAAQFRLGNLRSSLLDCRLALSKTPAHKKALVRAAQCCLGLKRFKEGVAACDKGLEMVDQKDEELLRLRRECVAADKEAERNQRRAAAEEKKRKAAEDKVLKAIQDRGITVQKVTDKSEEDDAVEPKKKPSSSLSMDDLEPTHPSALRKRVHFSEEDPSKLVWPVLLLYPEHGETDFIEEFEEDQSFADHLEVMFGEGSEPAPWDTERKYQGSPGKLRIYFEETLTGGERLVEVEAGKTLREALSDKRYKVLGGTPGFIVLVEGSNFQKEFLKKYHK